MTYDGHGRMKTRHYPVEDANTNTTWIYNADDSIQQVVDPRNAITSFTYNDARGLLTNISYSVSQGSTISATLPVSFGYDAIGNRTSITDGTGTISYAYDQLSRIVSETRQFSGLSNNFTTEYEYTLAGGLKTLKDASDVSRNISYSYNKAGVLTTITGGGFGGATQLLQNRQVRAFGAVKREEYGNGFRLEQNYDNRQRISLYNVINPNQTNNQGNLSKIEYEYSAAGQVKRANNTLNGNFSWTFSYDHVGRLKSAETDPVPGIGSASSNSAGYDVWNNLTSRTIGIWGTSYVANYGNIYSNNRNTRAMSSNSQSGSLPDEIWQYDASGMTTATGQQTHKYDAAGRQIESVETSPVPSGNMGRTELLIQQTYDGEGRTAKRYERETYTSGAPQTKTVYYLRSTVLGGKVLAEVTANGQSAVKGKDYVYNSQGEAIAVRETGSTKWIFVAPATGSKFEADVAGTISEVKEYDPFGGEVSVQQPPPPGSPDWLYSGTYHSSANPMDGNGGCSRKGFPIDCAEVIRDVMFGDPRTMNDTCPGCAAGGGMWLSPEQIAQLESRSISFDEWDWLRAGGRGMIEVGGKSGYVFANIAADNKCKGCPDSLLTADKIPIADKEFGKKLDNVLASKTTGSEITCEQALDKLTAAILGAGNKFRGVAEKFINGSDGHSLWQTATKIDFFKIKVPKISIGDKGYIIVPAASYNAQTSLDGKTIVINNNVDIKTFPYSQVVNFLHEVFHKANNGTNTHEQIVSAIIGLGIDGINEQDFKDFAKKEGWNNQAGGGQYSDLLNAWITKHCRGNTGDWDYQLKRGQFSNRK